PPSTPASPEALQAAAEREVQFLTEEREAARALVLALDVESADVLGHASVGLEPSDVIEVGSTAKPFTVAAALEGGADPDAMFSGEEGTWERGELRVEDWRARESISVRDVIVYSSNIGAAKVAEQAGVGQIEALFRRLNLDTESAAAWEGDAGLVRSAHGGRTSLLALARAYAVIARGGTSLSSERVLSEDTAAFVQGALVAAVGPEGTGHQAAAARVPVAGKTGTTRVDGSLRGALFSGFFPADAPKVVVVVYAEVPDGWGGEHAAPSFARMANAWADASAL
ncbi:MAG: penicillin-binding transpeptidase domain-containing protein, partial [Myxococcota bacterium]